LADGSVVIGEQVARERIPTPDEPLAPARYRIQVKVGNRDAYGMDFRWIDEERIVRREFPEEIVVLERLEWGDAYGVPLRLKSGGAVATGESIWERLELAHAE